MFEEDLIILSLVKSPPPPEQLKFVFRSDQIEWIKLLTQAEQIKLLTQSQDI